MQPVLLNIGPLAVSSFGFFLAVAFLASVFISWRLAKAYDLSQEQVLDLSILSFFGGVIGARVYFVLFNWSFFAGDFSKVVLINRYPGLSFWGGLVGGILMLWLLLRRTKLNFWQVADFAAVAFLAGSVLADIGCFLGGCSYGAISNLPLAVPVVGLIGKRFPVTLLESILILLIFFRLWKQIVRFHFAGKIFALSLIYLGLIKLITEFFRGDSRIVYGGVTFGHLWAVTLALCGILAFYRRSKRSFNWDLAFAVGVFYQSKKRKVLLSQINKDLYNYQVGLKIKTQKGIRLVRLGPRILKRRLNVKSTPTNYR